MKEKNKKHRTVVILAVLIAVAAVAAETAILVAVFGGRGGGKLAFSDKMITETVVNEMCDISGYVENPEGKVCTLTASYLDENGAEQKYLSVGLSFKPTKVGDVTLTVTAADGEAIKTIIKVTEAAPTLVTTNDARYFLRQTIQLKDLIEHVEYKSNSEPEFIVHSVEFGAEDTDLTDRTEYTFNEVGSYSFKIELKNTGGKAEGLISVKVIPELTDNEKDDLTNNSSLGIGSHATLKLCEDDHAENSDWSWEVKAHPADVWSDQGGTYYTNIVYVDFGQEIDLSKYYFTMDIKANENSAGIAIHYLSSALTISPTPMGYQDVLGRWTHISSQGKYSEGLYTGIYIVVMHNKEVGAYDPTDVKVLIDNLHIHPYQNPDAPVIVGGNEDFEITQGKVTWNSKLEDTGYQANYVQFNKKYTNQTMTFTTTIQDAKKPNLIIGARMDGANIAFGKNTGLLVRFYDEFFEVYAPKYGEKWQGAANVSFESGKKYTFSYSVETLNGEDNFFLVIRDSAGKEILNYSLALPANTVNASGNFVIWSSDAQKTIEYSEPATVERKANVNVVVPADGSAGVAGISTSTPGVVEKSAYLAMDGNYRNQQFTFRAKITDPKNPNLIIGARMEGIDKNPGQYKGITIRLYDKFFEVYGPKYGEWLGAANYDDFENSLKEGEYTFKINVETEGSTHNLTFLIMQGNDVIVNYVKTGITADIPSSGRFMVWSLNETADITYQMPAAAELPKNINVSVGADGTAGEASLKTVEPNKVEKASYLVMNGAYTNEAFEFTTDITDAKNIGLIFGAHLDGIDSNPDKVSGVTIHLYSNFYEVYAPKYGMKIGADNYNLTGTDIAPGKYTFTLQVQDGKLNFIIMREGTLIHSKAYDLPSGVPDRGKFAVWNMASERTILYQMPVYVEPPANKNVEVENPAQGGTAELKTIATDEAAKSSYLAVKGNYTNEEFTFRTTIADGTKPNLIIGAHMSGVNSNPDAESGMTIRLYSNFYEVYAPKYGTWTAAANYNALGTDLTAGEYTICMQILDNKFIFTMKQGDNVLHTASYDVPDTVPASGSFMVWNLDAERTIAYEAPKVPEVPKTEVNVVVDNPTKAGEAKLETVTTGDAAAGSYLAVKGAYTNDIFTFRTIIADGKTPNLIIGARMAGINQNPDAANGVTIRFYDGFYEAYAPKYGTWIGAKSCTLTSGKEYTFAVQVIDGKMNLTIKDGDTEVHTASVDVPDTVPTNGSFMMWNLDAERTVNYEVPEAPAQTNVNVEVENPTEAGTAVLKTVNTGDVANGSYLAVKGAYTNETFIFRTTIAEGGNPNLLIGARMGGVNQNPDKESGVTVRFYNGFYEAYAPKYGTWIGAKSCALTSGKEYTFAVQVIDGKLNLTIKDGDTEVHTAFVDVPDTVPTSGSFMVWNLDAERTIDYEVPEAPVLPTPEILAGSALVVRDTSGKAAIQAIANTNLWSQAYMVTEQSYSAEHFAVTVEVAEGEDPNLIIGARMNPNAGLESALPNGVNEGIGNSNGVFVHMRNNYYNIYAPGYNNTQIGLDNYYPATGAALGAGTYTFGLEVSTAGDGTSTVVFTVHKGNELIHTKTVNTAASLGDNGKFAVWSQKDREIDYTIQ